MKEKRGEIWKFMSVLTLMLLLIVSVILGFLLYSIFGASLYVPAPPSKPTFKSIESTNIQDIGIENLSEEAIKLVEIEAKHINYVLYNLKAYQLHKPILSEEVPVIEMEIDGISYTTEIEDGNLVTKEGESDSEDMKISTTKQELIEIINSDDVAKKVFESIEEGQTTYEITSNERTLLLKGYVNIYEELTGKEIGLSPKGNQIAGIIVIIILLIIILFISYRKVKKK